MTDRRIVGGSAILAMALLLPPHMTDARAVNMVEFKAAGRNDDPW